jgi:hypothetical protein
MACCRATTRALPRLTVRVVLVCVATPRVVRLVGQVSGRHLAFDGRLLHGALHTLAAATPAPYVRVSVLVNIWHRHRPLHVERLPADFAAGLTKYRAPVGHERDYHESELPLDEPTATWLSVVASSAEDDYAAAGDGGAIDAEWNSFQVGYIPLHPAVLAAPNWRVLSTRYGIDIGAPFRHLPMRLRHLVPQLVQEPSSHPPRAPAFVHVRGVELECDLWSDGDCSQRKDWLAVVVFLAEL